MFSLEDKVYIVKLKKKGVVKEVNGDQYKVTYFDKDDVRQTEWFKFNDLKKYQTPLEIKIKYFDKELQKVEKIKHGDWLDLRSAETVSLKQGEFKLIPLGVAMQLPKGYEANVVPRSSTYKNFGIIQTNSYGVIDNSYSGDNDQWHFPAVALRDTLIQKGDRICQFRIQQRMPSTVLIEVEKLGNKDRGGIGSTGTK